MSDFSGGWHSACDGTACGCDLVSGRHDADLFGMFSVEEVRGFEDRYCESAEVSGRDFEDGVSLKVIKGG